MIDDIIIATIAITGVTFAFGGIGLYDVDSRIAAWVWAVIFWLVAAGLLALKVTGETR